MPAVSLLESCSKEEIAPAPTIITKSDCLSNGTSVSIGSNQGHSLAVSMDDVQSGVEKIWGINS